MHILLYFYMLSMCAHSLSHTFMSVHTDGFFFVWVRSSVFLQRCTLTNPQRDTALAPPRLKLRLSRSKTTVISVSASLSLFFFFHFEAVKKERLKVLVLPVNHHHHHRHHFFEVLNQVQ